MFACVIPLSQASSSVIINVFGYMLNVCLCCPVSSARSKVIINVCGYMLNVCLCFPVISAQ